MSESLLLVTYWSISIPSSKLVIWSESMETENLQHEDHPSSHLCQWPWHMCHALLVRGTWHMHPIVELYHLFSEGWYGGKDAICLDMESLGWHKLLEKVPGKFQWTKIDLEGQLQFLVCLGTKVHFAAHCPAELFYQQEWHLYGSSYQTFSVPL